MSVTDKPANKPATPPTDAAPRGAPRGGAPDVAAAKPEGPDVAAAKPPGPVPATAKPAVPPVVAPGRPRGAGSVLSALVAALLAGGLVWLWMQVQDLGEASASRADVAALREQVRGQQQRIAQLEQRPAAVAGAPVDLRPLEARIAAVEQRPAGASGGAATTPVDLRPLDLRPLEARLAAVEQRPTAAADPALGERLAALDRRMTENAQRAAMRTARLALLQRASASLEAGQPLGVISAAPAALARFAAVAPPTEASLRLAFPEAARLARGASRPEVADQDVTARIWQRVRNLVTLREGDTVLLGSPAATVLGVAAERLAVGDIGGAVVALDALDPAAAAAMAGWRAQVGGLLAARAALAEMLASAALTATQAE